MLSRDISSYGAPATGYGNKSGVRDPNTDLDASYFNRLIEDMSAASRTSEKAWIRFQTRTTNGDVTISARETHWGSSSSYDPTTATRTAAGVYQFTWPSSFVDGVGTEETVLFNRCVSKNIYSSTQFGQINVVPSGATVTVYLYDMAGVATDFAASTLVEFGVR